MQYSLGYNLSLQGFYAPQLHLGFLGTNKRQMLNCVGTMVICGHKADRKKTF